MLSITLSCPSKYVGRFPKYVPLFLYLRLCLLSFAYYPSLSVHFSPISGIIYISNCLSFIWFVRWLMGWKIPTQKTWNIYCITHILMIKVQMWMKHNWFPKLENITCPHVYYMCIYACRQICMYIHTAMCTYGIHKHIDVISITKTPFTLWLR